MLQTEMTLVKIKSGGRVTLIVTNWSEKEKYSENYKTDNRQDITAQEDRCKCKASLDYILILRSI